MKYTCEPPYRALIAAAGAARRIDDTTPERHVRALALELARHVLDLDGSMRGGLTPPKPWQVTTHRQHTEPLDSSPCALGAQAPGRH